VLTAEASACVKALQAATDFCISQIQLEMDSSILKQALLMPSLDLAASGMLIRDIRDLLHEHFVRNNDIILIRRTCNSVAHELARLGMSWDRGESCIWTSPLLEFVKGLVTRDFVSLRFQKKGHSARLEVSKKKKKAASMPLSEMFSSALVEP